VPAIIAPYVLEKIGLGAARSLFVTGDRFDAEKALRIGLVQQVAHGMEDLSEHVDAAVRRIVEAGPTAIATAKQLLRDVAGLSPDEAAERTAECIARIRVSAEGQEGIHAFLEKRKPAFAVAPESVSKAD
jgi:enoyl-CoA hydratase/carnithine racemase